MVDTTGPASAAATTVAIQGLGEDQCDQLRGIKVGSLLEIAVFTPARLVEADGVSDDGDDGVSDGEGDGYDSEDGEEDGEASDAQSQSSETDEQIDTPEDSVLAGEQVKQETTITAEDLQVLIAQADRAAAALMNGVTDPAQLMAAALNAELTWSESDASAGQTPGPNTNGAATDLTSVTNPNGQASVETEATNDEASDNQDDAGEGEGEEDSEGEGDEGEGDSEAENEDGVDYYEPPQELSRQLYVVVNLTSEADGDETTITDVHLRCLKYQNRGEDSSSNTFRMYGNTIALSEANPTPSDDEELSSLEDMIAAQADNTFIIHLNPGGDRVRRTLFGHICPAQCARGWLPDQEALKEVFDEDVQTLRHYRPACPVCLGKDLTNEHMLLRGLMAQLSIVDLGMVVEFFGRLNTRRSQLGYRFVQFDEREWGYGFDDMLDESDSDRGDRDDAAQFEHWDEAMDPNANPKTRPASEATLAALPRKKYTDVAKKVEGAACIICQVGTFGEETDVIELLCGHVYDEACLETWIKSFDNCPECRATVSGMVGVEKKDQTDGDAAGSGNREGELDDDGAAAAAVNAGPALDESAMDGEDTVMSEGD